MKNLSQQMRFLIFFWSLVAISCLSIVVSGLIFGQDYLGRIFFGGGAAMFTDFSDNFISAQGFDCYSYYTIIYPPIVALFFHFASMALPDYLRELRYEERSILITSSSSLFIYSIFIITCLAILLISIWKISERRPIYVRCTCMLVTIFSYPVMYAFQRGNTLLMSVALLFFFLAYYRNSNKILNELAIIALSLSISIKMYPVIFALYLARVKDWKTLLKAGIYTVLLVFVPFIFYGGLDGLYTFITTAFSFSSEMAVSDISTSLFAVSDFLILIGLGDTVIPRIAQYFIVILLVIASFISPKKYQQFACYGMILLVIDMSKARYCASFLTPALVLLLCEEKRSWRSYITAVPLVLMLLLNGSYISSGNMLGYFVCYLVASTFLYLEILIVEGRLFIKKWWPILKEKVAKKRGEKND